MNNSGMDYKVRRVYLLMLSNNLTIPKQHKVLAKGAIKALIDFKRRYPTRKCSFWVPK